MRRAVSDYRVFRPTYTDKSTGQTRTSPAYHVAFRDHLNRRQTLKGATRETGARKLADRVCDLVHCRRAGEPPPPKLQKWLDSLPPKLRRRLIDMDVIDARSACADTPLTVHLEGEK